MNDKIRKEIHAELRRRGWSKAELSQESSQSYRYLRKMLGRDKSPHSKGKVGLNWLRILDYFGYELVIVKKEAESQQ